VRQAEQLLGEKLTRHLHNEGRSMSTMTNVTRQQVPGAQDVEMRSIG
jgi:hypothetical protein